MGAQRQLENGRQRLQLGENTVLALSTGGKLGAVAVEFDVQLTKDKTPILYHDCKPPRFNGTVSFRLTRLEG